MTARTMIRTVSPTGTASVRSVPDRAGAERAATGRVGAGRVGAGRGDTRPPLSAASRMLMDRSSAGLLQASAARSPGERYVAAHLAALRAAAAVLAARGRPAGRPGPRSVWEILPRNAPELVEWAAFFTSTASRRAAVEAGRGDAISSRDADDLIRDAEAFHHVVEGLLGLPFQQVLPEALPACG